MEKSYNDNVVTFQRFFECHCSLIYPCSIFSDFGGRHSDHCQAKLRPKLRPLSSKTQTTLRHPKLCTPWHKTNKCRKNALELIFARLHSGPVFALARLQQKSFEELFSECLRIFGRTQFCANTCRACISRRIVMYWFRARRYLPGKRET